MAMYLCDGYRVSLNTSLVLLVNNIHEKILVCDWLREMQLR